MSNSTSTASWPPWPPSDETEDARALRLQDDAEKKRHSDIIDHGINLDRKQRMEASDSTTKILLLGQYAFQSPQSNDLLISTF